ncbi:DUF4382 domain-containing protein [Hymenobacter swuensis]|uniref:DUF4382 domain-containing protein n=1 Tax=Hymenobacter swuensis DY53 TaxID=1227739 RepID=W8FDF6_9BACT|nr:DUF4382 domain-containing protein [Hymenobacter swuensis]AHJ99730.1 hypothetical protein Hsw_4135 [Hymenobacter swuensis DY53]
MKLLTPLFPTLILGAALLSGCSDTLSEIQPKTSSQQADSKTKPSAIGAVLIDLEQAEGQFSQGNKVVLPGVSARSYDLLSATNGRISLTPAFSGTLQSIRLVLGTGSQIQLANGTLLALDTPSGTTSGLKIQLDDTPLEAGTTYLLTIDFSVERDIVSRGNGTYGLKPVLRGTVIPASIIINVPPTLPTPPS